MALLLGVDTGGTFTDAVVFDDALAGPAAVIGKAKAPTTRHDFSQGVGAAAERALQAAGAAAGDIALVSLSTTLATNALVEGHGEPVALIAIGFDQGALGRAGLAEAMAGDPVIRIAGGHDAAGDEARPLDEDALRAALAALPPVSGLAIAAEFSVRNPAHERRAREIARAETGLPVTCSHELSRAVGGPKRALTTVLNARLVGLIDRLVDASERRLAALGISAPLMVVRGDGALVSADFARRRPIETILSGPAASLVGAAFLAGAVDAVVADIGGTTTDIAVMRGGRPRLDPAGAAVGGWRTMVEAAAVATHGLGGDSEARMEADGLGAALRLGPRRAAPLCVLAQERPELRETLARQLAEPRPRDTDGRFLIAVAGAPEGLAEREAALLARLSGGPAALADLPEGRGDRVAAQRLTARGLARIAAVTPTDAAHLLGLQSGFDTEAARLGLALLARQRRGDGGAACAGPDEAAHLIVETLRRRSAEAVLDAAFAEDGLEGAGLSRSALARAALDRDEGVARVRLALTLPVIGLGAAAPAHYGHVAALLDAEARTPEHAEVANAVGAVAGRVTAVRRATIVFTGDGGFRLHLGDAPELLSSFEAARETAEARLSAEALDAASKAGAAGAEVRLTWEMRRAAIEGRETVVEATLTAEASGRPRLSTA